MKKFLNAIRPRAVPLVMLGFFIVVGVVVGLTVQPILLANFIYIGGVVALGMTMMANAPRRKKRKWRMVSLFAVGLWMFGFVGLVVRENMQLEGFWFVLLNGGFYGAVVHYAVAKVLGPLVIGRSWCGWSCWTAMVIDLLPYKRSPGRLPGKWGWLRYGHFALSLAFVFILWFGFSYRPEMEFSLTMWLWFVVGNALYYSVGIGLAFLLRDNRAFCKYVCPINAFLKIGARYALLKIAADESACTECGVCSRSCPMDIDVMYYARQGQRVTSTACILCGECINRCPAGVLSFRFDLDKGDGQDHLQVREW